MSHKEKRITGLVIQQDNLTNIRGGYNEPPVIHVKKPDPTPPPPPKKKQGYSPDYIGKTLI
ncbi:MAG TPA: hypothetical protein VJ440_00150 [Candidatus Brocadiaceae bacterium]|nr:hypothetical protein [Candidatus Brocadiaceae bacterium]